MTVKKYKLPEKFAYKKPEVKKEVVPEVIKVLPVLTGGIVFNPRDVTYSFEVGELGLVNIHPGANKVKDKAEAELIVKALNKQFVDIELVVK